MDQVDSVLLAVGRPGRYHVIIYLLLCLNYFPVVYNHLAMAFYGAKSPHHCKLPEGVVVNNESIPYIKLSNGKSSYDSCHVYAGYSRTLDNGTTSCSDGWYYTLQDREATIVSEFDLVCNRKNLSSIATTLYFVGVMVGGLIFGTLSDFFGRRKILLFTMYTPIAIGVGLYFVTSYVPFVILRLMQGILMQGLQSSNFVLIMELFHTSYRSLTGLVIELFWASGVMSLALIAYFIRDWHYIQLAITLPMILTIPYIWIIPESPRWLAPRDPGMVRDFFLHVAKWNKVSLTEDQLLFDKRSHDSSRKYTVLDMLKTPNLRKRSFIVFYISMVTAMGYYGLLYSLTSLAGNKYWNFFIGGAIELPAYILTVYIVGRFGRRVPLCLDFIIGGAFCLSSGTVNKLNVDVEYLSTGLALTGRFFMACCFAILPLYISELYPTVIRNVGVGAGYFWIRLGGVLFSPLLLLGDYTFEALPFILFGVLSIVGGLVTLLLPETLNVCLPNTIEEAENIGYKAHARSQSPINETCLPTDDDKQDMRQSTSL